MTSASRLVQYQEVILERLFKLERRVSALELREIIHEKAILYLHSRLAEQETTKPIESIFPSA